MNERFSVSVPNGRVKSAVSGGNWEGTGVTPDVRAPAADALLVARARTLRRLLDAQPAGPWRTTLAGLLKTIETQLLPR